MKSTSKKLKGKSTTKSNGHGSLLDRARQQSEAVFWKPTQKGDGIEGRIVRIVRDAGRFNSTFHHVETDHDGVQIVAASPTTVLGQRLADHQLEVGDKVAVLFLGEETGKSGQVFKNWSIASEKPLIKPQGQTPSDDEIPF